MLWCLCVVTGLQTLRSFKCCRTNKTRVDSGSEFPQWPKLKDKKGRAEPRSGAFYILRAKSSNDRESQQIQTNGCSFCWKYFMEEQRRGFFFIFFFINFPNSHYTTKDSSFDVLSDLWTLSQLWWCVVGWQKLSASPSTLQNWVRFKNREWIKTCDNRLLHKELLLHVCLGGF